MMNRLDLWKRSGVLAIVMVAAAVFVMGCAGAGAAGASDDSGAAAGAENGTITVSLSGAADLDDDILAVYLYAHDEHSIHTADRLLAVNTATIGASGNVDLVLKEDDGDFAPTETTFVGTAGTTYDMYIYTDSQDDGELDGTDDYEPVTSYRAFRPASYPQTVTIDGDRNVSVARGDMVDFTGGTVIVELSDAPDDPGHDTYWFYYAIYLSGATPGADDALAWAEKEIDVDGAATNEGTDLRARSEIQDPFYAVDGTSYDLYAIIDMDGSGHSDGITNGDLLYQLTLTEDGDKTIQTQGDDYVVYNQ
jgi:hypothetical protein